MKKLLLLLLLFLWWGCEKDSLPTPTGPAQPTFNRQDSLVAVACYESFKIGGSTAYHWDLEDCDTWGGLTVALDTAKNEYRIVQIIIDASHLPDGYRIPSELGKLPYLRYLAIYGDDRASGGIPKEIFDCPLEVLGIFGKGFGGTIPKEIGKVGNTLQWLTIQQTSIGGEIPEEMAALQNLQGPPILVGNRFAGKVPLCLRELPHAANLSYNEFTEMEWRYYTEDIGYVPILRNNNLSGEIPEEVLIAERWKQYKLQVANQNSGYGYDPKYFNFN